MLLTVITAPFYYVFVLVFEVLDICFSDVKIRQLYWSFSYVCWLLSLISLVNVDILLANVHGRSGSGDPGAVFVLTVDNQRSWWGRRWPRGIRSAAPPTPGRPRRTVVDVNSGSPRGVTVHPHGHKTQLDMRGMSSSWLILNDIFSPSLRNGFFFFSKNVSFLMMFFSR